MRVNGPHWELPDLTAAGLYPRRTVYSGVRSLGDFQPWIDRILNFPIAVFDKALRQIPTAWIGDDAGKLDMLLESLLRRRKRIPELIESCRLASGNPFPNWVSQRPG
jgi:hypothetical protein